MKKKPGFDISKKTYLVAIPVPSLDIQPFKYDGFAR